MQPETNHPPADETQANPNDPITAGQLAKRLDRSRYGVKQAIKRLGIQPAQMLNGVSFYNPVIETQVKEAMRGPNLQTLNR